MDDGTQVAAAAAGTTDSTQGTDVPVNDTVAQSGIVPPPGNLNHPVVGASKGPKSDNLLPPGGGRKGGLSSS